MAADPFDLPPTPKKWVTKRGRVSKSAKRWMKNANAQGERLLTKREEAQARARERVRKRTMRAHEIQKLLDEL